MAARWPAYPRGAMPARVTGSQPQRGLVRPRPIIRVPQPYYRQLISGVPLTNGQAQSLIGGVTTGFVQTATATGVAASLTVTLPAATGGTAAVPHCLVACIVASTGQTITGITLGGAAGNWASAKQQLDSGSNIYAIWTDYNCTAGQTSVVVSFAMSAQASVQVYEFANVSLFPVDQSAAGTGVNGLAWSSGAAGPTNQASELAVGMVAGYTAGGTLNFQGPSTFTSTALSWGVPGTLYSGYQVLTTVQAVTYSGINTPAATNWASVVITLRLNATPASQGIGTVTVTPQGLGTVWYPAQATISTSVGAADTSTCSVFLGALGLNNLLVGQSYAGGGDTVALSVPPLTPGALLIAQWSGGTPGSICSMNVLGTMDCLAY
jgi:hypothetical protein